MPGFTVAVDYGCAVGYAVQTPVFEGPFDVLLHLITKQQVELYEVSISEIVDGFMKHLTEMTREEMDLETVTEFLLIAATLVELKTRRLLPGREEADLDEELALWEERDLLLSRLIECKTFKDAALELQAMEERAKQSYSRRAGIEERFLSLTPDLLANIDGERLRKAFLKASTPKPEPEEPRVDLDHVTQVRLTVYDAMSAVTEKLMAQPRATFRELTKDYIEPMEKIVTFLGLLELYKQGMVDLEQAMTFGELHVSFNPVGDDDSIVDIRENMLVDAYEG